MQHAVGQTLVQNVSDTRTAKFWQRTCGLVLSVFLSTAATGGGGILAANTHEPIAVPATAPGFSAAVERAMLESVWTEPSSFAPGVTATDVAGSIAAPAYFQIQIPAERAPGMLKQQDATDATAGSAGQDGTVNGVPRETTDSAPAETIALMTQYLAAA